MIHGHIVHSATGVSAQEYLAGWQRARAELKNLQAQVQQTQLTDRVRAQRQALEPLLQVADNMRAIITHVPTELSEHDWVAGVLHVARQLEQVLTAQGVDYIDAVAEPFDPRHHEAVERVAAADQPAGTVVEVVQRGYRLGETVLRPARVKVAA